MDRNVWQNRARRATLMVERGRSGSANKSKKTLSKISGDLSSNKENESRGTRRSALGAHGFFSKNERHQTVKEVNSRRSITRRLSFHKTDMESADESPFIRSGSHRENCQDVDESMLYPLNSTAVMNSDPSPFRLDLIQKGDQNKGYPSVDKQFNSFKDDCTKIGGGAKVGLSDHVKQVLRNMGIETSPDAKAAKQDSLKRIPEKSNVDTALTYNNIQSEQKRPREELVQSNASNLAQITREFLEKDTQTTPKPQPSDIPDKLDGNESFYTALAAVKGIVFRHFKERDELLRKQKKEMEELMSVFEETSKDGLSMQNEKMTCEEETRTGRLQSDASTVTSLDKNVAQSICIEVPSMPLLDSQSVAGSGSLCAVTSQMNRPEVPVMALDDIEPPKEITSIISPNGVLVVDGAPSVSAPVGISTEIYARQSISSVATDKAGEWESSLFPPDWRRVQEVSFIETPQAGKWLVTEEVEENLSMTNTPTLGLDSMLQGMSIQGQPSLMETPATRRLVTKRILKGVESLFY